MAKTWADDSDDGKEVAEKAFQYLKLRVRQLTEEERVAFFEELADLAMTEFNELSDGPGRGRILDYGEEY